MTANVQLNLGTGGDLLSAEDLGGGVKLPRGKIALGVGGVDGDVAEANPMPIVGGGTIPVNANVTLTATGSLVVGPVNAARLALVINVTGTVSGTTPVLAYTMAEVDPQDQTTVIGDSVTGANITATATTQVLNLNNLRSSYVKVTWTITGTTPSFGSVKSTVCSFMAEPLACSTAARTDITAAAANTSILAANPQRRGVLIFNDSTSQMFLLYGTGTSSATVFSVKIPAAGYWEMPRPIYNGLLQAFWTTANGAARVTELT